MDTSENESRLGWWPIFSDRREPGDCPMVSRLACLPHRGGRIVRRHPSTRDAHLRL
jgi:hypothetical protein